METAVRANHVPAPLDSQLMVLGNYFRVRDRYPQVSAVSMELTWRLNGFPTVFRVRTLSADDPATFKFACPFCTDAAVDLSNAVHDLFVLRKAAGHGTCLCTGSPDHARCASVLSYRLRPIYR